MGPDQVLDLPDAETWAAWLEANAEAETETWLRIAKRGSGLNSIAIADALDVALCFGWIDGQRRSLDDVSFLQRYCRRRPRSSWSQVNVAKVEALIEAGRMRPGGFAEIERAKADGRWAAAYASQATAVPPDDLIAALAEDPRAAAAFAAHGQSYQYVEIIMPLLKARTPATRATTLARLVARLHDQAAD